MSCGRGATNSMACPVTGCAKARRQACKAWRCRPARGAAVQGIGHQRVPDRGHVHADLVRAARVQAALDPAKSVIAAEPAHVGTRGFARVHGQVHHGHAQAVARVATNRRVDAAQLGPCPALVRDCLVLAAHAARGDHAHQRVHGAALAGHHEQAAGVFVEPVHDARARHLEALGSRASRPLSRVPLQFPGAGCTTMPAGL